ncbi:unnamed protein product, partial [Protopolystoma xenopodis]
MNTSTDTENINDEAFGNKSRLKDGSLEKMEATVPAMLGELVTSWTHEPLDRPLSSTSLPVFSSASRSLSSPRLLWLDESCKQGLQQNNEASSSSPSAFHASTSLMNCIVYSPIEVPLSTMQSLPKNNENSTDIQTACHKTQLTERDPTVSSILPATETTSKLLNLNCLDLAAYEDSPSLVTPSEDMPCSSSVMIQVGETVTSKDISSDRSCLRGLLVNNITSDDNRFTNAISIPSTCGSDDVKLEDVGTIKVVGSLGRLSGHEWTPSERSLMVEQSTSDCYEFPQPLVMKTEIVTGHVDRKSASRRLPTDVNDASDGYTHLFAVRPTCSSTFDEGLHMATNSNDIATIISSACSSDEARLVPFTGLATTSGGTTKAMGGEKAVFSSLAHLPFVAISESPQMVQNIFLQNQAPSVPIHSSRPTSTPTPASTLTLTPTHKPTSSVSVPTPLSASSPSPSPSSLSSPSPAKRRRRAQPTAHSGT